MSRISMLSVSLASKCRILFGLAVLLIISSALLVPWIRMRDLVHDKNLYIARQIARLALAKCELEAGNWELKQDTLAKWWPSGAVAYGVRGPVPLLIPLADPGNPRVPAGTDEYLAESIAALAADRGMLEAQPLIENVDGNLLYHVVLPVRSVGGKYPQGTLLGVVAAEYPAAGARVELLVNLGLILMAGALAGILAVLVFYIITQKLILSPVRQLTRVAESVSEGEHSVRSQIATGDEFEELARAFNAMLAHLQASENELRTMNKSLDTRLGEVAERNVALFEANKIKNQFLANVSHELRTPLTSIIGFAELLREAATAEGGRTLRYAENIMASGRLLLGIINDLLDLAKIEAGKLELHLAPLDLAELAGNLIDFMRPLADKKNLDLTIDVAPDVPQIVSDAGRIQQILYNLLSNAVKFTPERGSVQLRINRMGSERVILSVHDTGIGIPEKDMSRVFEKFWQIDDSMTREHSGTGLGLAISRELAGILGGTLEVSSVVGSGSIFTLSLPMQSPAEHETSALHAVRLN